MNTRRFFGCRCHYKKNGTYTVIMSRTIEEADRKFESLREQYKAIAKNIITDEAGMYADENFELTKEDLELPWED